MIQAHRSIEDLVQLTRAALSVVTSLELREKGKRIPVPELGEAIGFIRAAKSGGVFISGGEDCLAADTLEPLNWAKDVFIAIDAGVAKDYQQVVEQLDRIEATIRTLNSTEGQPTGAETREAVTFFSQLAACIGSYVDQHQRDTSPEPKWLSASG